MAESRRGPPGHIQHTYHKSLRFSLASTPRMCPSPSPTPTPSPTSPTHLSSLAPLLACPPAPAPLPLSPELTKFTSPQTLDGPSHPCPCTVPQPQRSLMPALPKRASSHPYPSPQSLPSQPLCLTSSLSGSGRVCKQCTPLFILASTV